MPGQETPTPHRGQTIGSTSQTLRIISAQPFAGMGLGFSAIRRILEAEPQSRSEYKDAREMAIDVIRMAFNRSPGCRREREVKLCSGLEGEVLT